jgi:hypothetical protein
MPLPAEGVKEEVPRTSDTYRAACVGRYPPYRGSEAAWRPPVQTSIARPIWTFKAESGLKCLYATARPPCALMGSRTQWATRRSLCTTIERWI